MKSTTGNLRRAFSFAELLIVISILAIVSALVVPLAGDEDATGVRAAAELLAADIEDIQARSLAEPGQTSSLIPHADSSGWYIARTSEPGQPINGVDGRPLIRRFGSDALAGSAAVVFTVPSLSSSGLAFDDQGAPLALSEAITFRLATPDDSLELGVRVSAATGRVSITRE